jgi:exosortase
LSATAIPSVALAVLMMTPLRVRTAAPEMSFSPTFSRFGGVIAQPEG